MNEPRVSAETETLLQQLTTTVVGRRWLLKAGLGTAAAMAAASLPVWSGAAAAESASGTTGGQRATSGAPGVAITTPPSGRSVKRTFQFALGRAMAGGGISNLELLANGARLPLVAHTGATRAALKAAGGLWAKADLSALTHYVQDVAVPGDRAMVLSVNGTRGTAQEVVAQLWHVPEATTLAMAGAAASVGNGLHSMLPSDARLKQLGLGAAQVTSPEDVAQLGAIFDPYASAVALVQFHPNVATVEPTSASATSNLLHQTPEVTTLGDTIAAMHAQAEPFATKVPITDADGTATQFQITDASGVTTTFTSTTIQLSTDSGFSSDLKSGVSAGIQGVRNTGSLGTVVDKPVAEYPIGTPINTWLQSQGVTPHSQPYAPASPSPLATGGTIDVNINNTGDLFGTTTVATGGITTSRQVPIRIYNNWVRWMWAYVQYLGTDSSGNTINLSLNSTPTWPDTQYSQSLALVPQVFTVLGVPLWDTNTVDVTLTFPEGAHTARLLYCGLGSDINGGGWRQYFPSNAYTGLIAPKGEVLFPAVITGILTIGLNVFALATDLSIALAWAGIRGQLGGSNLLAVFSDIQQVVKNVERLTAAETLAVSVGSGSATYVDVADGGGTNNIWSTLLGIATLIPKLLFPRATSGFWSQIGATLGSKDAADKLVDAIPIVGEALAIIQVLGDVATLAEVAAETIVAPWVIENEVTLTYQANVTIGPDPDASGWPATAATWTLSPVIDGLTMPKTNSGDMSVGGRVGSDPLQLVATAPFGGKSISWSMVVLDSGGHQVGSGVSPSYPNNDVSNPATTVSFDITEIPAPITADTTFARTDTLIDSSSAGGYTWSNDSSVTSAAAAAVPSASDAIQVMGATVATKAGVVGIVWKQNDRYYLQGIPVDQNTTTLDLGAPSHQGYARQPFLLFDAMVRDPQDAGNHVLLEPDDTSDVYYVRHVDLDPTTGAVTWDSNTNLGTFTLPVSAAALHSSGHIVTVHTDSGRLGRLHPADSGDPAHPTLAAYSGGQGTQIGLLQSPTAVAITNPGVVIVLEAGAGQLAAFDLNGNPMQYFGSDPNSLQYTLPLATSRTYLDLAVDGASHIYLLYYTGGGSDPGDYRVDVYNPDGEPLNTQNSGVNIARLGVDFWRSIYGVNFTWMSAPGSTTLALPSISRFDPTSGGQ